MASRPGGPDAERFRRLAPKHDYRVYLGQYFEPHGLLPAELKPLHTPEYGADLKALFRSHPSQLWWSRPFFMPSLSWRSELPRAARAEPEERHRWSIGFLAFERSDVNPRFDSWAASLKKALRAFSSTGDGDLEEQFKRHGGRASRTLGIVQLDPHVILGDGQDSDNESPCVIEVHLNLPHFARRGHWHIVDNIAGTQYGLIPFCGISLFFQRGLWVDCAFVAVQSALMITEQRLGGKPNGVFDLIGNAVAVLLDLPHLNELKAKARRKCGREFQDWLEQKTKPKPYYELVKQWLKRAEVPESELSQGQVDFPTPLELIALALRLPAGPQKPPCYADFNCSAVVEFVVREEGSATAPEERLRQLLVDYLSDGFPVVAAVNPRQLDEYQDLLRWKKREAAGGAGQPAADRPERQGTVEAAGDELAAESGAEEHDHAILVFGAHLTRPSESGDEPATYGTSADAFVVSDLCFTPFLKVDADNLCKAMMQTVREGEGGSHNRAEFLVVLPKGVELSAHDARRLTHQYLGRRLWNKRDVCDRLDDPAVFALRASLFTAGRALERFAPVIPDPADHPDGSAEAAQAAEAQRVWAEYCTEALSHKPAEDGRAYFWSIEVHQIGPSGVRGAGDEWAPHRPLYTLHWQADRPLTEPGRRTPGDGDARTPALYADHGRCADDARREVTLWVPEGKAGGGGTPRKLKDHTFVWREGADPKHV